VADPSCRKHSIAQARLEQAARSLRLRVLNAPDSRPTAEYVVASRNCPRLRKKLRQLSVQPEVVQQSWLEHSQQRGLLLPTRQYSLPLFHGLVLCSTGMSSREERDSLAALVEYHGGRFLQDLDCAHVSHLVAVSTDSKKFEVAFSEGLYIVSTAWVHDSINADRLLPEESYFKHPTSEQLDGLRNPKQQEQRPTTDGSADLVNADAAAGTSSAGVGAFGTVGGPGSAATPNSVSSTRVGLASAKSARSPAVAADHSAVLGKRSEIAQAHPGTANGVPPESVCGPDHQSERDKHASRESQWQQTEGRERPEQQLQEFGVAAPATASTMGEPDNVWQQQFLSAAVVALVGFRNPSEDDATAQLMRLLAAGGAVISDEDSLVTHAIVHPWAGTESKPDVPSGTLFVSCDWVEDSCSAKRHLDERAYLVDPNRVNCRSQRRNELVLPSTPSALSVHLSEFLSADSHTSVRAAASTGHIDVVRSRLDAHVTVVDHTMGRGAQNEVTPFYIERCVTDDVVHSPRLCAAFQPLPWASHAQLETLQKQFEGVHVCGTGYTLLLRGAASELCNVLGASYESTLMSKGSKQTTHLLCEREATSNNKCKKARQIGASIVTMAWLVDSACHLQREKEENYRPEIVNDMGPPQSQAMAVESGSRAATCPALEDMSPTNFGRSQHEKKDDERARDSNGAEGEKGNEADIGMRNLMSELGELLHKEQHFLGSTGAFGAESQVMGPGNSPPRHAHAPSPAGRMKQQQAAKRERKPVADEEAMLSQLSASQQPRVEIAESPQRKQRVSG